MRKIIFVIFAIFLSFTFLGCVSGPKSFNLNKVESKTFTLSKVTYMTNIDENKDIQEIFSSLPIQAICKKIESEYGIVIDNNMLFNTELKINSYNLLMPNYFVDLNTNDLQRVSIFFGNFYQEKDINVDITFNIYKDNKISQQKNISMTIPR